MQADLMADVTVSEKISPIPKKEKPARQYYCATCTKMSKNFRCSVFERRVEPDNRCFYHSHYQPSLKTYVSPTKELFKELEHYENGSFKAA